MWGLQTIVELNLATAFVADHKEAAEACGIRVLGNAPTSDRGPRLLHYLLQMRQQFNEVMGLDHIVPYKIVTKDDPEARSIPFATLPENVR